MPKIALATPSSHPTNLADPVEREYLFLTGSRKTTEADPHSLVLSHMRVTEPITVARARLYVLELLEKG